MPAPTADAPFFRIGPFPVDLAKALRNEIERIKCSDPLAGVLIVVSSRTAAAYTERDLALAGTNLANIRILTLDTLASLLNPRIQSGPNIPSGVEMPYLLMALRKSLTNHNPFGESTEFPGFSRSLLRVMTDSREADIKHFDSSVFSALGEGMVARLKGVEGILRNNITETEGSTLVSSDKFKLPNAAYLGALQQFDSEEVIFYGLYDFNELQYNFVCELARKAPATFLIPAGTKNNKPATAYRFIDRTLDRLTSDFPMASIEFSQSSLPFEAGLFDYSIDQVVPALPIANLEVFQAIDAAAECDLVAGRIADLVFNKKTAPEEIGVILWEPDSYRLLLIDALERASIPVYDGIGQNLARTPSGRALIGILSLDPASVSARELLDLLQTGALKFPSISAEAAILQIEKVFNTCGVVRGGPAAWERSLLQYRSDLHPADPRHGLEEAALPLRIYILRLLELLVHFDNAPTFVGQVETVIRIVDEFLVESTARDAICKQLDELKTNSRADWKFLIVEFIQIVTASLSSVRFGRGEALVDGVALLSPMTARNIRMDHLFLPGLTQNNLPARSRESALLPDEIRCRINRAHSKVDSRPLPLAGDRIEEEKFLFCSMISFASVSITLSYPVRTIGETKTELPSQFLLEACRIAAGFSVGSGELQRLSFFHDYTAGDLGLDWQNRLVDPSHYLLQVLDSLPLESRSSATRKILSRSTDFSRRITESNDRRSAGAHWTEFDGMPGAFSGVCDGGTISVTELEAYAECPFRCWLTRRLNLSPWRDPEISLEIPSHVIGRIVHQILNKLFELALTTGRIPLTPNDEVWIKEQLPLFVEAIVNHYRVECPAPEGIWLLAEKSLIERIEASIPGLIELQVGYRFQKAEHKIEHRRIIDSGAGDPFSIILKGRVDRIDHTPDGSGIHVIDYKTGQVADPLKIADGTKIQLPLYLSILLAENPQLDINKSKASYLQIGLDGAVKCHSIEGSSLANIDKELQAIVRTTISGIKSGFFPPLPMKEEICETCSVSEYCDIRSRKSATFKRGDERLAQLLQLRGQA